MNRAERRARTERTRAKRLRTYRQFYGDGPNSRIKKARRMHPLACGGPCDCSHSLSMTQQEFQAAWQGADLP